MTAAGGLLALLAEQAVAAEGGEVPFPRLAAEQAGGVAVVHREQEELLVALHGGQRRLQRLAVGLLRGGGQVRVQLVPAQGGEELRQLVAFDQGEVEPHRRRFEVVEVLVLGVLQDLADEDGDLRPEGSLGDVPAEAGARGRDGVEDPLGGHVQESTRSGVPVIAGSGGPEACRIGHLQCVRAVAKGAGMHDRLSIVMVRYGGARWMS